MDSDAAAQAAADSEQRQRIRIRAVCVTATVLTALFMTSTLSHNRDAHATWGVRKGRFQNRLLWMVKIVTRWKSF